MSDLELFRAALEATRELLSRYDSVVLKSIIDQLNYLIDVETGKTKDTSRLANINIGILAVREVEDMDPDTAEQLHKVSAAVRRRLRT
jgi:hypothetical protein